MKRIIVWSLAVIMLSLGIASTVKAASKEAAPKTPKVATEETTPTQPAEHRKGEGRGGRGGMKRFDKDGDGKLSDEEKAEMEKTRQEMMKKFDTDGDGKISKEEREKMRTQFQKGDRKRPETEKSTAPQKM